MRETSMREPVPERATVRPRRILSLHPAIIERFGDPFRPLEPDCKVIQFDQSLPRAQLQQAAGLLADRPDVELYVYGRASPDLSFLQYFPMLRRLHIALYELEDIAGLSHVAGSLEELTFGQTKQSFSLVFLAMLPRLRRLFLVRHKRDLPAIGGLGNLTQLGLSGITLPDLSVLLPLTALRELSIFLGGTTNLALLPRLAELEYLWLMRITKLSDLRVLFLSATRPSSSTSEPKATRPSLIDSAPEFRSGALCKPHPPAAELKRARLPWGAGHRVLSLAPGGVHKPLLSWYLSAASVGVLRLVEASWRA